MRWMDTAWTLQGVAETPGDGTTPAIRAMFADAGRPDITSDETAWCAAFVGACLVKGGISIEAIPPPLRLLASSYETFGTPLPLAEPRVGAIAVFDVGGATGSGRHTGFVSGWTETTIAVLGGNQRDAANVTHFKRSSLVALRWPEPEATAKDLLAAGSRTVKAAAQQTRDAGLAVLSLASAAGANVAMPDPAPARRLIGNAAELMQDATQIEKFMTFALAKWPWIAGAVACWFLARMALAAGWITEARVEDHNTGANVARRSPDARAA